VQRLLGQAEPDDLEARSHTNEVTRFAHDFSQIPVHAKSPASVQAKLTVSPPGVIYEREADRIAEVMAAPAHHALSGAPPRIQRFGGQPAGQMDIAPASVDQVLASPGKPLEPVLRQNMEQRFGHDFSRVRVHTGTLAEQSARDVMARAYTAGYDIVFGAGGLSPGTHEGRWLIAHELTHVVQQSGADGNRIGQNNENRGGSAISQPMAEGRAIACRVQRAPAPPPEIEMPAEYAFALDERKQSQIKGMRDRWARRMQPEFERAARCPPKTARR